MKLRFVLLSLLLLTMCSQPLFAQKPSKKDYVFTLSTRLGDIQFVLFEETPIHRENFLKLTEESFFDSLLFHRVIKNFMIQGGDPTTHPSAKGMAPQGFSDSTTLPAEIMPKFKHKKGAVAAARMGGGINPKKRSSNSQFYIVQNDKGTPHLDGGYTVFGQVILGIEVVDLIAKEKTKRDRPKNPVYMTITVKKMSKKKITKEYGYVYEGS